MDAIPIFSQIKSLVQVISGDADGARITQENFSKQCPIVSQTRSLVEVSLGDSDAARRTQEEFLTVLENTADAIPVVGHVKGGIHYAMGDTGKGDESMKSSSRTTGVVIGGAAGFLAGGPAGSIAGGVAGGSAMDGIITGADSAVHEEFRPHGHLGIIQDPENPGKWCDVVGGVVIDGYTGHGAGAAAGELNRMVKYKIEHIANPNVGIKPSMTRTVARAVADVTIPQDVTTGALALIPGQGSDSS